MPTYDSRELTISGPSFAIEVTGSLFGIDVLSAKVLSALVEAVTFIISAPIKKMIVQLNQTYADIEVECNNIRVKARLDKLHNTAHLYSEAIAKTDHISWATPEVREELRSVLMQDLRSQLRILSG